MTRAVSEWIGATDDSAIPARVRLRVFERHEGRCHISGRKIMPGDLWDLDHVIALCNWTGEGHGNRESNLAPALRDKHREKTAADVAEKSRVYRKRAKAIGAHKPKQGFAKSKWVRGPDGQTRLRDGTEGKMR